MVNLMFFWFKMIKEISSTQNPIIKDLMLSKTKKGALSLNACFIETEKVVKDCLNSNLEVLQILIETKKQQKFADIINKYKNKVSLVSESVSKKLSETNTPSGIYALVELPKQTEFNFKNKFLVLDSLQDPTNLGAIIRSAVAFGYTQIICINGVFPYLSKVIRSSMGYVFKISFLTVDYLDLCKLKETHGFKLISANLNGTNLNNFKPQKSFGLVIGNEGNGVSPMVQSLCDYTVTIPMQNNVESLNASISASILMYNL